VNVLESVNSRVNELSDRLHQLETSFANHSVPSKILDNSAPSVPLTSDVSVITSTVTSLLKEERERQERKLNAYIHGVPKSTSEIPTERSS